MISRRLASALVGALLLPAAHAGAPAQSLDQLYQQAQQDLQQTRQIDKEREARFLAAKDKQQTLLKQAEQDLEQERRRGEQLKKTFDANNARIDKLQGRLKDRSASLDELFGVVRQVAGDTSGIVHGSLISAQYPGRDALPGRLAASKALPSIKELEQLWLTLLQQMTESGKVVKFQAPVVMPGGAAQTRSVTRGGALRCLRRRALSQVPAGRSQTGAVRPPARRRLQRAGRVPGEGRRGLSQHRHRSLPRLDPHRPSLDPRPR